ncbi:MAG: hypothetical protein H7Z14_12710 [Anaerolineae bacterium]|nr:hypothetical protein [Phycisphaerae bacterium]
MPRPCNKRRRTSSNACNCESLEPRRMLAVFNGTSGNDTIEIFRWAGGGMAVRFNGGTINTTTDLSITVNAGLGNDTFNVSPTHDEQTILARGDGGNDTLVNPVRDLDDVYQDNFTFDGGSGSDTVLAENGQDETTPYTMHLSGFRITKGFNQLLEYDNIESVRYFDNDAGNLIRFQDARVSSSAGVVLEINGNGGNDTIYNASDTASSNGYWFLDVGTGNVVVNGGTGVDGLLLSDASSEEATFGFDTDSVDARVGGVNIGVLFFAGFETIDFVSSNSLSGEADNVMNVFSKPNGVSLRIDSGPGNDTFHVGGGDFDNSGLALASATLLGGTGADSLVIEDTLDKTVVGESESYTWQNTTFVKGVAGINYSEFESQTLQAANGLVAGSNVLPIVNLNATASSMSSTTIIGGPVRGCRVDVGQSNFSGNINGALTVTLVGGALDVLNINNQSSSNGSDGYHVTQTQIVAPKVVNYSGVRNFNINASANGGDSFVIDGLAANTALVLNGNSGNEQFLIGGGNISTKILGSVTANGGSGADTLSVFNQSDPTLATQTLNGSVFTDGQSHSFNTIEELTLYEGPGGTNLNILATACDTDVRGNSGNDHYTVGGGDIDANLRPGVNDDLLIYSGTANPGNDTIRFDDLNDTNLDTYFFERTGTASDQLRKVDGANQYYVAWSGIASVTLDASNAPTQEFTASSIVVTDILTPLRINGNGGSDSVSIADAAAPVVVNTGLGDADSLIVNTDSGAGDAPVTVVVEQSDDLEDLDIRPGGTLRVGTGATVVKTRNRSLNLTFLNGVLDLAGGAFISRAGGPITLDGFRSRIIAGRNGGAWNGTGAGGAINSSLAATSLLADAVGYGLGSEIAISSIGGFSIAGGDVLLRYTFYGDTDLNGVVDFDDYSRIDAGFNNNRTGWVNGDCDYNDVIDFDDYSLIDLAFNTQISRRPFRIA